MSNTPMFIQNLRPIEILLILLVILLLFGAKKLPDLARGVGRSLRIFRAETRELREDEDAAGRDDGATDRDQPRTEARQIEPTQTEPAHDPASESAEEQLKRDA